MTSNADPFWREMWSRQGVDIDKEPGMTNVVELRNVTKLDIPPERVLDRARDAGMQLAIVIGLDSEGEFYFASSAADGGTALWWIEKAKKALLSYGD